MKKKLHRTSICALAWGCAFAAFSTAAHTAAVRVENESHQPVTVKVVGWMGPQEKRDLIKETLVTSKLEGKEVKLLPLPDKWVSMVTSKFEKDAKHYKPALSIQWEYAPQFYGKPLLETEKSHWMSLSLDQLKGTQGIEMDVGHRQR